MSSSARLTKTYATAAGNIDCIADGGTLCDEIICGGEGNLQIEYSGGATDTIAVAAGDRIPAAARRILAAGTTATALTVMWWTS